MAAAVERWFKVAWLRSLTVPFMDGCGGRSPADNIVSSEGGTAGGKERRLN